MLPCLWLWWILSYNNEYSRWFPSSVVIESIKYKIVEQKCLAQNITYRYEMSTEISYHEVGYSLTRSLASGKPSSLSNVDEPCLRIRFRGVRRQPI